MAQSFRTRNEAKKKVVDRNQTLNKKYKAECASGIVCVGSIKALSNGRKTTVYVRNIGEHCAECKESFESQRKTKGLFTRDYTENPLIEVPQFENRAEMVRKLGKEGVDKLFHVPKIYSYNDEPVVFINNIPYNNLGYRIGYGDGRETCPS